MSTPYNVHNDLYRAREAGRATLRDPGAGGVVVIGEVDRGVCVLSHAGTNSLEAAAKVAVGVKVLIIARASVTVNSIALANGESVEFRVTLDNAGARQWVAGGVSTAVANAVTRAAVAAGAGLVPVSTGANRALGAATPASITGDTSAYVEATLKQIITALAGYGLVVDNTTT